MWSNFLKIHVLDPILKRICLSSIRGQHQHTIQNIIDRRAFQLYLQPLIKNEIPQHLQLQEFSIEFDRETLVKTLKINQGTSRPSKGTENKQRNYLRDEAKISQVLRHNTFNRYVFQFQTCEWWRHQVLILKCLLFASRISTQSWHRGCIVKIIALLKHHSLLLRDTRISRARYTKVSLEWDFDEWKRLSVAFQVLEAFLSVVQSRRKTRCISKPKIVFLVLFWIGSFYQRRFADKAIDEKPYNRNRWLAEKEMKQGPGNIRGVALYGVSFLKSCWLTPPDMFLLEALFTRNVE